jgi:hypothetical protein
MAVTMLLGKFRQLAGSVIYINSQGAVIVSKSLRILSLVHKTSFIWRLSESLITCSLVLTQQFIKRKFSNWRIFSKLHDLIELLLVSFCKSCLLLLLAFCSWIKLFHLLLILQRGQATTRVVYNIKFMTRWFFLNRLHAVRKLEYTNMNKDLCDDVPRTFSLM